MSGMMNERKLRLLQRLATPGRWKRDLYVSEVQPVPHASVIKTCTLNVYSSFIK